MPIRPRESNRRYHQQLAALLPTYVYATDRNVESSCTVVLITMAIDSIASSIPTNGNWIGTRKDRGDPLRNAKTNKALFLKPYAALLRNLAHVEPLWISCVCPTCG